MRQAFIIMQIGNPDLDEVCEHAIVPALKSCDLDPKRVDKHNVGRLLKSEIVEFIETSDIIIGDLTNARPNCYLEIGYAMGLDKFRNLILTAREDHNPSSRNFKKGGPKIHFDLSGYDILFWDAMDLDKFREDLEKRVRRRLATAVPYISQEVHLLDEEWLERHRSLAFAELNKLDTTGFMEIRAALLESKLNVAQGELLAVAERAQVHTFGWPIGVVLHTPESRPRPTRDGIVAEIHGTMGPTYDYWTIRKDGAFYQLRNLFEDERNPSNLFFNTRIVRITETLLYLVRLYTGFGLPTDSRNFVAIRHGGLENRLLSASGPGRYLSEEYKTRENEVETKVETTLEMIESDLAEHVEKFTKPLFVLFNFFELSRGVLEEIVDSFVAGKVT